MENDRVRDGQLSDQSGLAMTLSYSTVISYKWFSLRVTLDRNDASCRERTLDFKAISPSIPMLRITVFSNDELWL